MVGRRRRRKVSVTEQFWNSVNPKIDAYWKGRHGKKWYSIAPYVAQIIHELEPFWPITVRQIYYKIVSSSEPVLKKWCMNKEKYQNIDKLLGTMQDTGLLNPRIIADNSTETSDPITDQLFYNNYREYIEDSIESFIDPQYFNILPLTDQPNYIEIWAEKRAIFSVVKEITDTYHLSFSALGGFIKRSFFPDYIDRVKERGNGKKLTVVYLGDHDPSGRGIAEDAENKLDANGLDVDFRWLAITTDQVDKYNLHQNDVRPSEGDPRYNKWKMEYPDDKCFEVDSLDPSILQSIVKKEIESIIDMNLIETHKRKEDLERWKLKDINNDAQELLKDLKY